LPKDDAIEVTCRVVEKFKAGMFSIELKAGRGVLAPMAGKMAPPKAFCSQRTDRALIPSMRRPVSVKGDFLSYPVFFMTAPFCTYANIAADLSPSFHPHS
jgi:hypothetical protein